MPTTNKTLSKVHEIEALCVELVELLNDAGAREREQHEAMQELLTRYELIATYAVKLHNTLAVAASVSDTNGITSTAWIDTVKEAKIKLDGLKQVVSFDELLMWCS